MGKLVTVRHIHTNLHLFSTIVEKDLIKEISLKGEISSLVSLTFSSGSSSSALLKTGIFAGGIEYSESAHSEVESTSSSAVESSLELWGIGKGEDFTELSLALFRNQST